MTEESSSFNPGKNFWGRKRGNFWSKISFFSPFRFMEETASLPCTYFGQIEIMRSVFPTFSAENYASLIRKSLENPYKNLSSSPRFTWSILYDFGCITLGICARLLQLH